MRVPIAIFLAAGLLGCAQQPKPMAPVAQAAYVPPTPAPPTQQPPICARPQEKQAVAVSALISELQVITTTCHTEDKYNALVPRLRPALAVNNKALTGFFARAYGAHAQTMHDGYITELANAQSQLGLQSGDQFCPLNVGMLDEVMALSDGAQLAAYATSKPIQQVLAVQDCTAQR